MSTETASRPRRRVGRYVITGRIGRGGMGMVYRGYDETLERNVAIKTLTVEGNLDDETRRRFEVEAKAAARLQHPNILTVFELGEERGVPFIAMELLPGVDLETVVRSGEALLLEEKVDIVVQVCRGLAYAHERGIVHRDIKPSNVRLLDDGTTKIMDFGIAKLGGMNLTKTGMMVGTVFYMSPEQIRAQPLDGRSDVFAVGVILYELLAGRKPFGGPSATEVLYQIVHDVPKPPGPLDDPRLQGILDRSLAKRPEERFRNAAEMADALVEVLQSRKRGAPPAQEVETVATSRRLLQDGRAEEAEKTLSTLLHSHPESVDARRLLRTARRALGDRNKLPDAQDDDFPELDATFQSPPTQLHPGTAVFPTTDPSASLPAPAPAARPALLIGGILAALALVSSLGLFFLLRPHGPEVVRIAVDSRPSGASVLLGGKDTGLTTKAELVLPDPKASALVITLRKSGYRERSVTVEPKGGQSISLDLSPEEHALSVTSDPVGAVVAVDGQPSGVTPLSLKLDPSKPHKLTVSSDSFAPKEVPLPLGQIPPEVKVVLESSGPPGTVTILTTYPVDVVWKGKILSQAQSSPQVQLPTGRQVLTISSSAYFLKMNATVDVKGGATSAVETPGLGRISIRANPDNCQVFIDGAFVDYPPILGKSLAAGGHTVQFRWPDGSHSEEVAQVGKGDLVYVTGRKG